MPAMRAGTVVAACAALACDSNTGPRLPFIPPLGTYTYTFTHPADANGIIAARSFSGTLVLTYATADSIAGRWEVSGYASQPFEGARGLDVGFCVPDLCPAPAPGPQPAGSATDSLPYRLGAFVVDGTASDSSVPAVRFLFWHADRVVCGGARSGVTNGGLVLVVGTCSLELPRTIGAAAN
jgi:hypothetical protein